MDTQAGTRQLHLTRRRARIDLGGGDWEMGSVPPRPLNHAADWDLDEVTEWLPATVPGDVRVDLLAAGRISDPYVGMNNEESQWVDERDWWYRKTVSLALAEGERAFLVFDGIDYISAVFWDGQLLGRHEGMFSRQVYEVTDLAAGPERSHVVAVRILGSAALPRPDLTLRERAWDWLASRVPKGGAAFPDRFAVLKCQMGFGWDFAARLRTMGIWDGVTLEIAGSARLRDPQVGTTLGADGGARIDVDFGLDTDRAQRVTVHLSVHEKGAPDATPPAAATLDLDLAAGAERHSATLDLARPKLWEPWDRGESSLYELTLSVADADGAMLDDVVVTFGVREIKLGQPECTTDACEPYLFTVNGRREFIRGANWVPPDAMPGRVRRAQYEALLDRVRAAGINLLRVWGGGLREKKDFYELCDEKGILVWQEFPFACAFYGYFPLRGQRFPELVREECGDIVRQLRNHPSLVVWCGGNEFSALRNRRLIALLRAVVAREDGTRPFRRVSPDRGEAHNWVVWHSRASVSHFRRDRSRLLGEFGLQSTPAADSLRRFIRPENLWPPNHEWTYHGAELRKMYHYASPWLCRDACSCRLPAHGPEPEALAEFVAASQQAQAHGIQVAVEHVRRRKGETGGAMVWQFNEPWPAISWSLVDYYGQPKAAYYTLTQVYNPILISVLYPLRRYHAGEKLPLQVWAVNDLLTTVEGAELEVALDGKVIYRNAESLSPDSSRVVTQIDHVLDHEPVQLEVRLTQDGRVLSENEYDLRYDVRRERCWPDHLFAWLGELLLKWS